MSNKILVTDSLFIFDEHVEQLKAAGFEVERLDKPQATEEELCKAVKGKVGYILGGIEKVTDKVINTADELKAIIFTGADWAGFIPGHEVATKKEIAIANTPGANTYAVAEYTLTLMLIMLRKVLELTRVSDKTFMTAQSLTDVKIGVVGMGRIGERVTRMLKGLGVEDINYWNRTRKLELEKELGLKYLPLEEIYSTCDLISYHVSSRAGQLIGKDLIKRIKKDSIIINAGSDVAYDVAALYDKIIANNLHVAFDYNLNDKRYKNLPLTNWFCSNSSTAYNTYAANKLASDMATQSIINLLKTGSDDNRVN